MLGHIIFKCHSISIDQLITFSSRIVQRFMCLFLCLLSSIPKIFESIVSHWIFLLSSAMVSHLGYMLHVSKRSSNSKNSPFYGHLPWIRVLDFWGSYIGVCVKFVDDFKSHLILNRTSNMNILGSKEFDWWEDCFRSLWLSTLFIDASFILYDFKGS